MNSETATLAVLDALERLQIRYMIVGSLSVNAYAIPRSTQDADLVLETPVDGLGPLRADLDHLLRWEPQLSLETVTGTFRQIAELRETAFKFEFFALSDDPHDRERFARRQRIDILGRQAWVASAEDVVVTKLRWSRLGQRRKDVDDVRALLSVSGQTLDWNYIHRWCDQHGTRALLDEIRRSVPDIE